MMEHLPQHCIAVSLVTNNDSDGTQIIDAIQLLLLLLHFVVHTPQVLGPTRQLLVAEICKSSCVLGKENKTTKQTRTLSSTCMCVSAHA